MPAPFTIVQLTDPHLGAPWSEDPASALAAAVASVDERLDGAPDAVIVTGDIASTPTDAEYEQARGLLEGLGAPLYVLAGNHDERDGLRRSFDLSGAEDEFVNYAVSLGPVRLVGLDTKREGSAGGQLDTDRISWLDRALAEDRETPTLLAMHHPPIRTGIPAMDLIGIPGPERAELAEVVGRHRQVQLIAAGHVHRTIVGQLGQTPVVAIPSTDVQLALDFAAAELHFVPEPPCFAVHVLADERIVSHVQPIAGTAQG